jgi:hypothetical protein
MDYFHRSVMIFQDQTEIILDFMKLKIRSLNAKLIKIKIPLFKMFLFR